MPRSEKTVTASWPCWPNQRPIASARRSIPIRRGPDSCRKSFCLLQAFLDEGVNRILTTDHDLAAYEGGPEVEVL